MVKTSTILHLILEEYTPLLAVGIRSKTKNLAAISSCQSVISHTSQQAAGFLISDTGNALLLLYSLLTEREYNVLILLILAILVGTKILGDVLE